MLRRLALVVLVLGLAPLAGCIEAANVMPANAGGAAAEAGDVLPETISALEALPAVDLPASGTGIRVDADRGLLYAAVGGGGLVVFDVTDPAAPVEVGHLEDVYARDVDFLSWDGRELAFLAGAGEGVHVVDVTDPAAPTLLATADAYSSHNLATVPGTPFVYDATATQDRVVPVLDVTDPANPSWITFPIPTSVNGVATTSDGCHDVVVRVDLGRAYCAGGGSLYGTGGGESFIWDISEDPTDPAWIGLVDHPSIMYHHQAIPSEDGTLLFLNDEFIAPNCHAVDVAGLMEFKQSTAAMWVFDVTDPANPELLSYVQPDAPADGVNCGSHFGDLVDGRPVLVWGWYQGGTLLIDVSDPAAPVILDQKVPDGSNWESVYHNGHVYGSTRTLQVFKVV